MIDSGRDQLKDLIGWVARFMGVRRGEAIRALLLSCHLSLVIASYVVLKAVRDALYIDAYGAMKLPFVIIGIAVVVGLFVDVYIRLSRRVPASVATSLALAFFVSNLLLFWSLAASGVEGLYPAIYIWAGCFGVIAPVQVWTLFNEAFSTREAKRLVGPVGAGGIIGAIAGGALAGTIANFVGTVDLLLVVAGALTLCIGLVAALSRQIRLSAPPVLAVRPPANLARSSRLIASSPHLRIVAGLVAVSALATTIIDWQFKATAGAAGFSRDELTAFFGATYGFMALASLLVQMAVVRGVFRRLGLGAAVLILPLSLLGGTTLLLAFGSLWAATLMKSGDGAFKHSVDRSSKELSWLPVDPGVKVQVKSAIDMVLDRLGDGLGGVLLMLLATFLGFGPKVIGLVNFIFLGTWLVLARRLSTSYRRELANSIGHRGVGSALREAPLLDADARRALRAALASDDPSRVIAALDIAAFAPGPDLLPEMRRLARHGTPEVRAHVLSVLLEPGEAGLPEGLSAGLEAEDQTLLAQALDVVLAEHPEELRAKAEILMGGATPATRGAMLALLVRRLGPTYDPVADGILDRLLSPDSPSEMRAAAACAIGLLPAESGLTGRVRTLLGDADPAVRARAAESAERLRREDCVDLLVPLLESRQTRGQAASALASLGDASVPALMRALSDPATDARTRRRCPRLLAEIGTAAARDALVAGLSSGEADLRDAWVHALSRLRRNRPGSPIVDEARLETEVLSEISSCRKLLGHLAAIAPEGTSNGTALLKEVLEENLQRGLHRVFGLLELRVPPEQAAAVYRALRSDHRPRRDNAVELLEGMLPKELKPLLIPLVEFVYLDAGPKTAGAGAGQAGLEETLAELAASPDGWIAACARRAAMAHGLDEAERTVSVSDMTLVDRVVVLKSIDAFKSVPAAHLARVAHVARERAYEPGEMLFREGEPAEALFVLLQGRVALRRGAMPIGEITTGVPFGAWSLFDEQPRPADAVALEPTDVLIVDREEFYEAIAENPEIARSLFGDFVRRLRSLLG
jgi:ATP/ADP translocase